MFCTVWPGAGINVSECLALVVRMVLQLVAALSQPCFIGTETVCIKHSIFIRLWHSVRSWLVEEGRRDTVFAAATWRSEARAWVVLKDVRCLNCLLVNTGHYQLTSFPCWHVVATFGLGVIYKIADVFHHFSLRVCERASGCERFLVAVVVVFGEAVLQGVSGMFHHFPSSVCVWFVCAKWKSPSATHCLLIGLTDSLRREETLLFSMLLTHLKREEKKFPEI